MIGRQVLAEFTGVVPDKLIYRDSIESFMRVAAQEGGMTPLEFTHTVNPDGGFTAALVLSESHLTMSTFPSAGMVMLDCFTCGERGTPEEAIKHLRDWFDPLAVHCQTRARNEQAS